MIFSAISLAVIAAATAPVFDEAPAPESMAPGAVTLAPTSAQDDPVVEEKPGWEGSFTVGVSITDGNTDIQKASAAMDAVKELEKDRYTVGLSWNFSEENGVVNQRKTYGKAQYDRFLTEKSYWLVQASAEADKTAGVDLRTTVGVGLGYQVKDTEKFKLSGEAGLSSFSESFTNGMDSDYIAARLAYNWAYLMSDKWSFEQTGVIFPSLEDSDDIYSKIDTRAKASLTDNMFAQLQWVWDWDNTPAAGAERSDHLYLLTVGWSF